MKTTIIILALAVILAAGIELKISLNPLRITAHNWHMIIGFIFLSIAVALFNTSAQKKGYRQGFEEGSQAALEAMVKVVQAENEANQAKEDLRETQKEKLIVWTHEF